jgi:tetratricopeptide (TPR) repeat protein
VQLADPPSSLSGQVVVFTGRLSSISHKDAHARVQECGGTCADEVTSRTTMLVLGAAGARGREAAFEEAEGTRKVRRAEQVNTRTPGQIRILSEEEFCAIAGLPSSGVRTQQFFRQRDIRAMYPLVREEHLRYMAKCGLINPVFRTRSDTYFSFQDLASIRLTSSELEQGAPFRAVVRAMLAEQHGQLTLDFRAPRADAQPAKVVALERRASTAPAPRTTTTTSVAARYFLEGSELDDGDVTKQEAAMAAYRKALAIDTTLVPALVNLANIHYARDEAIEAQALYERAISLDADCFEAHFNLGNIYHDLLRYEEALACYRDALALNSSYPDAHFYLAVTLEKIGRSQDAKPHWRTYQQLAPDGEWAELAQEFSD